MHSINIKKNDALSSTIYWYAALMFIWTDQRSLIDACVSVKYIGPSVGNCHNSQ